jgi:hypothetical protein
MTSEEGECFPWKLWQERLFRARECSPHRRPPLPVAVSMRGFLQRMD